VECIGKGKARAPYEFGCKVSITTPATAPRGGQFVLHAKALHGNPYDGHTFGRSSPISKSSPVLPCAASRGITNGLIVLGRLRAVFLFARPARWAKLRIQLIREFGKGPTMIDRDVKELYVGSTAIVIFALVLVWLQQ
jgi:hypothetical protein